jgi:hypothetical protein
VSRENMINEVELSLLRLPQLMLIAEL